MGHLQAAVLDRLPQVHHGNHPCQPGLHPCCLLLRHPRIGAWGPHTPESAAAHTAPPDLLPLLWSLITSTAKAPHAWRASPHHHPCCWCCPQVFYILTGVILATIVLTLWLAILLKRSDDAQSPWIKRLTRVVQFVALAVFRCAAGCVPPPPSPLPAPTRSLPTLQP
jgi:hypothetical protein